MSSNLLKLLLVSGMPSIVFDSRPDLEIYPDAKPFFQHSLLKNAILLKTGGVKNGLQTRLYLPFDSERPTRGGVTMMCEPHMTVKMLEECFSFRLDKTVIEPDIRKMEIFARTPSFSPFLLRDAFERRGVKADPRHFKVSDEEVAELKGQLKARLKPLAAMALPDTSSSAGAAKLDMFVGKLWDLDDPAFLSPFAAALQIPPSQSIHALYGWIGVSYFHREFTKRQSSMRRFASWLVEKPPFGAGTREEVIAQFEADREPVRDQLRNSWAAAAAIFDSYNTSYDRLIQNSDAMLFASYLRRAAEDFSALGGYLAVIDQALCVHSAIRREKPGSQLTIDLIRELSLSIRSGLRGDGSGQEAA